MEGLAVLVAFDVELSTVARRTEVRSPIGKPGHLEARADEVLDNLELPVKRPEVCVLSAAPQGLFSVPIGKLRSSRKKFVEPLEEALFVPGA